MQTIIRTIDFESTGLFEDPIAPAICEVGWCDIIAPEDGGKAEVIEQSRFAMLVDPKRPMPPTAQAVHHISDKMLEGAAPIDKGLLLLRGGNLDERRPFIFAAHNAGYEMKFFNPPGSQWIDTYKVGLRLFPDAPAHKNQVLRYWLDLKIPNEDATMPPHRAGPDAYVTAHLLAHMINLGKATLADMIAWSSSFALYPKVPFGKHFGKSWESVPYDYLEWMCRQKDMDQDFVSNARHHMKRRGGG